MTEPRYLKAKDAAAYLSISEGTLRRLCKEGHLPAPVRIGPGTLRYDRLAIDAALADTPAPDRSIEEAIAMIGRDEGRRRRERGSTKRR
jgi:excisionase family DNA binding protein